MNPRCDTCGFSRVIKKWGKKEDGDWYEYDGCDCFHPEALKTHKPDKHGGVPIGLICWDCRGYWIKSGDNDEQNNKV